MSSTEESINNAISRLLRTAYEAQGHGDVSLARVGAIKALSDHWARFWQSSQRSVTPTPLLAAKLGRYVAWYTRAWVLLPPAYRARVPRPDEIDPSLADTARDTLRAYLTGIESTPQTAKEAAEWVEKQAHALRETIEGGLVTTGLGAIIGAGLVWWFFVRGRQ